MNESQQAWRQQTSPFSNRMIDAIERNDLFSLENWTTFELHDLEFAAELQGALKAQAEILAELDRRDEAEAPALVALKDITACPANPRAEASAVLIDLDLSGHEMAFGDRAACIERHGAVQG